MQCHRPPTVPGAGACKPLQDAYTRDPCLDVLGMGDFKCETEYRAVSISLKLKTPQAGTPDRVYVT
jgi:hypothetical protein